MRNPTPEDVDKSPTIDHPYHYGGEDNPYEAIKVIEAWGLDFNLGNALKYLARCRQKGAYTEDLKKCIWYIERAIVRAEAEDENPFGKRVP